jgi:hypothetical protein
MRLKFRFPVTGQPHLLASVSLISEEGDFAGLEISNFEVWARTDGLPGISITVPGRSFARPGGGRGRYHFVRDACPGMGIVAELRRRILAEIQSCYPHLIRKAGGVALLVDDVERAVPIPAVAPDTQR